MSSAGARIGAGFPRLRNLRDWQSLAYMAALPALAAWQWLHGFNGPLYALMLFLTLGIGVIHHNHTHVRMWHGRHANRLTDFAITLLQGHPTCVFYPAHVANHHRYRHGPKDIARTYRFGGGDRNDLAGYLLHPLQALTVLLPHIFGWLERLRRHWPGVWRYCLMQYGAWLLSWAVLLSVDPFKALLYVIIPQLHGLHWLLATNYLQHAHADIPVAREAPITSPVTAVRAGGACGCGVPAVLTVSDQAAAAVWSNRPDRPATQKRLDYARNFEGLVNPLLFNIGLHTAHHEHSRAHWSVLTGLHRENYRHRVHPRLNERGLTLYMARVFLLGTIMPVFRSRPIRPVRGNDLPDSANIRSE